MAILYLKSTSDPLVKCEFPKYKHNFITDEY